jgi:hypothetical protein
MISKPVLKNIYNDILELSSRDLQISYWLKGDQGKISGYVELMNSLFDDSDFDLFVDKEILDLKLSDNFIQEIQKLRDLLNLYNDKGKSQEEIIYDIEWQKITAQAQKVIYLWKKELGCPSNDNVSD